MKKKKIETGAHLLLSLIWCESLPAGEVKALDASSSRGCETRLCDPNLNRVLRLSQIYAIFTPKINVLGTTQTFCQITQTFCQIGRPCIGPILHGDHTNSLTGLLLLHPLKKGQKRCSRTRSCRKILRDRAGARTRGETPAPTRACRFLPEFEPTTYC